MEDWVEAAKVDDLADGGHQVVALEDTDVAVFNCGGRFYAIEDVCTHDGGVLTGGPVEDCRITCPRHGAQFDIRTGEVLAPPAYEPVHTFPVRLHEGVVLIRDDRFDE